MIIRIAAVTIVALVIAAVGVRAFKAETRFDPLGDRAAVERLFASKPPREAYEAFKLNNAHLPIDEQHTAAHMAGELLYQKEGIDGFSVCDGSFGFGCFHSFIALAIEEHGEAAVLALDKACIDAFGLGGLGCSHGLGHGVVSHVGYTPEALAKALALCDKLAWTKPFGGCRDGVFMEYNFRIMAEDPSARFRPFVEAERHEPCADLPASSRYMCYFDQASWWYSALIQSEDPHGSLERWCAEPTDEEARKACFRGIGQAYFERQGFDPDIAAAACDSINDRDHLLWCREGLAWSLYANPDYRSEIAVACSDGLSEAESARCMEEHLFFIQ